MTVRARAVVSACGALHTPVLLARSGVRSKALGKHLRLHPVLVIWGQFDEEVRPWEGMLASTFSDQDVDMDGKATASSTSTWPSRRASCSRSRPGAAGASTPS